MADNAPVTDLVVLLGAGASVEAGIPDAVGMTRAIADVLDRGHIPRHSPELQALHYAIGALVAHDTARGARAFDGVDVERLFAAIQVLADRDSSELAPFVAAWSPALDGLGPAPARRLPAFFGTNFARALSSANLAGLERAFKQGVEALTQAPVQGHAFEELQRRMMAVLRELVTVSPVDVPYLAPLLNQPRSPDEPIRIATLNYDNTIEMLCKQFRVAVDSGIEGWTGSSDWAWSDRSEVQLLKLHGSADWLLTEERIRGKLREPQVSLAMDIEEPDYRTPPAVVFGQRGKLRADGPFLPMLRAFGDWLDDCAHLVIVGYSLRDDHINAGITKWFNSRDNPRLTIIDPGFTHRRLFNPPKWTFASELFNAIYENPPVEDRVYREGFCVLNEPASKGLEQVFGPPPRLESRAITT